MFVACKSFSAKIPAASSASFLPRLLHFDCILAYIHIFEYIHVHITFILCLCILLHGWLPATATNCSNGNFVFSCLCCKKNHIYSYIFLFVYFLRLFVRMHECLWAPHGYKWIHEHTNRLSCFLQRAVSQCRRRRRRLDDSFLTDKKW